MTEIPAAPAPEYVFQIPPNWPAPEGFDPRHGYVIDPTWADAPAGWTYWAKPRLGLKHRLPRPSVGVAVRIVIGLAAIGLLVSRFSSGGGPGEGVGSCWASGDGDKFKAVSCTDSRALYRVPSEVADPNLCPDGSNSYLDTKKTNSATRYKCLVPLQ